MTAQHSNKVSIPSMAEMTALTATMKTRGAPWQRQIYFCFMRSIMQQYRMKSSFFWELGVGTIAGCPHRARQNMAKRAELPRHLQPALRATIFRHRLLLHPANSTNGLSCNRPHSFPAGRQDLRRRETGLLARGSGGHNRFAYYVGKVLSTIPRIVLANFHFSTLLLLLWTPRMTWQAAFVSNLLYFYCIYGLASCISMVTRREDGPLLAAMLSLIVGVLNGLSPTLQKVTSWRSIWLWRASPGTWLAEAYFTEDVTPLRYLYQIDLVEDATGYLFGYYTEDCLVMLALGTIYRIVAYLGLRFMPPSK